MADNFLNPQDNQNYSEDPTKDFSNKWRNIIFVILLTTGLLVTLGVYFFSKQTKIEKMPFVVPELGFLKEIYTQKTEKNTTSTLGVKLAHEIVLPKQPELKGDLPLPDNFTAESILVKDQKSGVVLYKKNEYGPRALASITKLMSALVILEKDPKWEDKVIVVSDSSVVDSYVYPGESYSMKDLWYAALVASSNKSIMTLADSVGMSREEFVQRMNQKALELGMADTTFVEPTGLKSGNISTASDTLILLKEAMRHEMIRKAVNTKEYTLYSEIKKTEHRLWNTNWLLLGWIPNKIDKIVGGKTGYIEAAGYNFSLEVTDKAGHVVDLVVFGTNSNEARFSEARDIVEKVFEAYKWPE